MGTIPFPGDGIAAHLAWIRDELGAAGSWLVTVTRRQGTAFASPRHEQQLTTDLLGTLEELTSGLPDSWCPNGSVEVVGLQVGQWSTSHQGDEHPFLELDVVDLGLADPNPSAAERHELSIEARRLPALYVQPLRRIIDRHWSDWERALIGSLVSGWSTARNDEVGLTRHTEPGLHRRWARAGHTILTELADAYDSYRAKAVTLDHNLVRDVHQPVTAIGQQILHEQQLAVTYGPLQPHHAIN